MPRPLTKLTDEQQALLAAAVKAAEKSDEAARRAEQTKDAAWQAILEARNSGVPDDLLCKRTGFSRATLVRKFGNRPAPE
ncbi:MAG: hypothetical protein ABW046_07035 [Actinoplanes sp.]